MRVAPPETLLLVELTNAPGNHRGVPRTTRTRRHFTPTTLIQTIAIMINPSDMTPDLPNLHSLTLEATPTYSSSSVAPHPPVRLPYVHTDQWLTKSIVAAAYQR